MVIGLLFTFQHYKLIFQLLHRYAQNEVRERDGQIKEYNLNT